MLRRRRNKHELPTVEVNIVPLMDILTTMLFFLVLMAGLSQLSSLKALTGSPSSTNADPTKPHFVLKIIAEQENQVSISLGKTLGLRIVDPAALHQYLKKQFNGSESSGFSTKIHASNGPELEKTIQDHLIALKKAFPHETAATLECADPIKYQKIVDLVGAIQAIPDTAEPFLITNFLGKQERTRALFPSVLIREKES